MAETASDWAWLPRNLLLSIVDRLMDLSDFNRFGLVCKPWLSITHQSHSRKQLLQLLKTCRNKLPMLLTTSSSDNNVRSLYSITDGRIYEIQMPLSCNTRFSGSSHGWLFMVDKCFNITLINPFLNTTLILPKFQGQGLYFDKYDKLHFKKGKELDYFIRKTILLSQNQGEDDFEVLLIYSGTGKLAYLKSCDAPWKSIKLNEEPRISVFSDIISYKGKVYGVSCWSALVRIDVETGAYEIVIGATNVCADITYLVESQYGDLLLIRKFLDYPDVDDEYMHRTAVLEAYKLCWGTHGNPHWTEVEKLGEQALFLGDNYSVSISTREFPQCKSNSIYYLDDYIELGNYVPRVDDDSGVYNLEDRSFSRHYTPNPSFCPPLPPIWIVPMLTELKQSDSASSIENTQKLLDNLTL